MGRKSNKQKVEDMLNAIDETMDQLEVEAYSDGIFKLCAKDLKKSPYFFDAGSFIEPLTEYEAIEMASEWLEGPLFKDQKTGDEFRSWLPVPIDERPKHASKEPFLELEKTDYIFAPWR
jgi:hypothetical protein